MLNSTERNGQAFLIDDQCLIEGKLFRVIYLSFRQRMAVCISFDRMTVFRGNVVISIICRIFYGDLRIPQQHLPRSELIDAADSNVLLCSVRNGQADAFTFLHLYIGKIRDGNPFIFTGCHIHYIESIAFRGIQPDCYITNSRVIDKIQIDHRLPCCVDRILIRS